MKVHTSVLISLLLICAYCSVLTAAESTRNMRQTAKQSISNVNPARLPNFQAVNSATRRSGTFKILALRVEFVEDTLSTTTGNGKFEYAEVDTAYFDPPPHDKEYFHDYLTFLDFYWGKMSSDSININWEILPDGNQDAFDLPRQMWQYNYNSGDEQLDFGLAQLFSDAVLAADDQSQLSIDWDDYDLVLVFHAGAGAEFDLGYTTTPHDLPSAWMIAEDLDTLGYNGGVPVNIGGPVPGGIILPETETHEGVQISMTGVICSMFGHWLGLPPLYDNDVEPDGRAGNPVVGKWSLMDRGFGNFYGSIPGQLDAWSRIYMEWLEPIETDPGEYSIAPLGFDAPDKPQAYKIPISDTEYFLLSCRNRDPELDTVAIAYDRNGHWMKYLEDYSVEVDPRGFRVPVRIDNLDFDSPGSGILIWHVDNSLLPLIDQRRFNSVNNLRGLDLEEADGAQDIGRNYPFLTPGYGTDYGIMADAWYGDNQYHIDANNGRLVIFDEKSYPSSHANSGSSTNIVIDNFSVIDTVMSFRYSRNRLLFSEKTSWHGCNAFGTGNFDMNPDDDEVVILGDQDIRFYGDIDGFVDSIPIRTFYHHVFPTPIIYDLNDDSVDEIVYASMVNSKPDLFALVSENNDFDYSDIPDSELPDLPIFSKFLMAISGSKGETARLVSCTVHENLADHASKLNIWNADLVRNNNEFILESDSLLSNVRIMSMHRLGNEDSEKLLLVSQNGTVFHLDGSTLTELGVVSVDGYYNLNHFNPLVADFNGNETQDLFMIGTNNSETVNFLIEDVSNGIDNVESYRSEIHPERLTNAIPVDIDSDGFYEILGYDGGNVLAIEINGKIADGFPIIRLGDNDRERSSVEGLIVADADRDSRWDCMVGEYFFDPSADDLGIYRNGAIKNSLDGFTLRDRSLPGFSMTSTESNPVIRLCQLDDEPDLEMVVVGLSTISAYNMPFRGEKENLWWGQPLRDNLHSNAVWEILQRPWREASAPLFVDGKCYNWPNPARGSTRISFLLNFDAEINVNIYDVMGERVKSLHGKGVANLPDEIIWDLTGVARGGYIAVVKATGSGKTETMKIKIAVLN